MRKTVWTVFGWLGAAVMTVVMPTVAEAQTSSGTATFNKDVAPILEAKCQVCHRQGQMGPMSLVTYQDVRPWVRSIRTKVSTRMMPPWHLDKTVGIQKFKNDISLSDAEINTIVSWIDAGAPQGDPKDLRPGKVWPSDDVWHLADQYGRQPQRRRPQGQVLSDG